MTDFDDLRSQLATASDDRFQATRALFRDRQRLAGLTRDAKDAGRAGVAGAGQIGEQIQRLEAQIAQKADALGQQRDLERARFKDFAAFTDPRNAIANLSDQTPILLLPVRIETRFKQADGQGQASDELWVRVYPDDIAIDAFEDMLSESEAQKSRAYWADVWRAADREADLRGAWRGLLSGQGSGRSHWVIQTYRPLNEAEKPVPVAGQPTVILTIVTQNPLVGAERAAVTAFWIAVWQAGEDGAAQSVAGDALGLTVGAARAVEIVTTYKPRNFADPPPTGADRAGTTVIVAYLEFPTDADFPLRTATWAQQPHSRVMPDRLVLLGWVGSSLHLQELGNPIPSPLATGPDPSADPGDQLRPDGDEIKVDPDMAWVTDFARAIEIGMGFRVPLTPDAFRRGFDRVMVLGLATRCDATTGASQVQNLFLHHHQSKGGLSILPKGRPTNNVEGSAAAYSWQEDPDISFDHYFGSPAPDPTEGLARTDGRRLAETLGLDPAALRDLPYYGRTDIGDATAMNTALWPATGGYFMEAMLDPVFSDLTTRQTRDFFTRYVSAHGPLPAIRVGKQPYGILPATARSRMGWIADRARLDLANIRDRQGSEWLFLERLYQLLLKVEADMTPLLSKVSWMGKPGVAPHQLLLDVVGLHSGSVEFQQRYAESFKELYNRLALSGAAGGFAAAIIGLGYVQSGMQLLGHLGYQPGEASEVPDILEKLFLNTPNLLKGPLIDDRPMSETDALRASTAGGQNYIDWMITAAGTSHEALRLQKEFDKGAPDALLFLMLRHALDLSYVEISTRLFFNAGLITADDLRLTRREPKFIGIDETALANPATAGGSRWQYLYRNEATITGSPARSVGAFIPTVLTSMVATDYLRRQLDALTLLKSRPTAALERALTEHIDLFTYRLDAWFGGLTSLQLEEMRKPVQNRNPAGAAVHPGGVPGGAPGGVPGGKQGLFLGAFGWLESVKPKFKVMTPVALDAGLGTIFKPDQAPILMRDSRNEGFIHAPSLNHAVTAAVLRNGYLSNATQDAPGSLAINLTSERVRVALTMFEGMQNQQSLAALLGYQFERGLHDRHDVEVDAFILDLRKVFPLVGDRLIPTLTAGTDELGRAVTMDRVEARNVIDGLALVELIKSTGQKNYPFGQTGLPPASPAQASAIASEADRIVNIADAVADLAMAESVHQVVQGNYERAAAVLAATSTGKVPQAPDVVQTPRSGVTLTHRVAIHLKTGLNPADPALTSPRARVEPAINDWLASVLPPLAKVACTVTITTPGVALPSTQVVTAQNLGLLPIDLLYLLDPDTLPSARELDDRIEAFVIATQAPHPDAVLSIIYRDRIPALAGHVPFFELTALIRVLRSLLLRSRPLQPTDLALASESSDTVDLAQRIDPARISLTQAELAGHLAALQAFLAPLKSLLDNNDQAQIASGIEATLAGFVSQMQALAPYAGSRTGTGTAYGDRRRIFTELKTALAAMLTRWGGRIAEFDLAITAYNADPGAAEADKINTLRMAERLIATARLDPLPPPDADAFRDALVGSQRAPMLAQLTALQTLHDTAATLSALHDGITASLPINAGFDPVAIDISVPGKGIQSLAEDIAHRSAVLVDDITALLVAVQAQVDLHDAAAEAKARLAALTRASRLMLGENAQIVPDFALPDRQAQDWATAWGVGATADQTILAHLTGTVGRRFPVDDWLTGIARVRAKISDLEAAEQLAEAFGGVTLPLQPLQFPPRADTPWLGLEYPETTPASEPFKIDEDKLLYTAHYATPFVAGARLAGVLLDEWTEVIPSRTEDTGLAFHYDRPNTEPPQVLLLAVPPRFTGAWQWQDLVDTVTETMDLAKRRAIEPDHIDTTSYARFLPAIVSAVTVYPITAGMNLAFNNGLATSLLAGAVGDK